MDNKRWWLICDEDVQTIKMALLAPTHKANDYNCEDWPPEKGCEGCGGNELRRKALHDLESGLHITNAVPDDWKEKKAKAVLAAVEKAVKECNECDSNYAGCKFQLDKIRFQDCPLVPIRKAWEEK